MTTPVPADLDDRLARIDARLDAVESELARRRGTAAPSTGSPQAPAAPQPWWPPPGQPAPWAPAPWAPGQGAPGQGGPGQGAPGAWNRAPWQPGPHGGPPPPRPAAPPRRPTDWSRLPVWAGAAVTSVGVLLLLVLAASSDWFGPLARVLGGAALGLALVAVAAWLLRRATRSGGSPGAGPAVLAGTGTTALFASVVAATTLYGLLGPVVGSVLCLLVAGGGIALADRWDSARLAVAVLVGAHVALIVVAGELDALSLGVALLVQLGVVPTAVRRAPVLAAVAAGGTALHALLAAPGPLPDAGTRAPVLLLGVGVVALVLGVAAAALTGLRGSRVPAAVGLALSPVPVLAAVEAVSTTAGVAATLLAAAGVAGTAVAGRLDRIVRATAVSVAAVLVAAATSLLLDGVTTAAVLLAEAVVLFVPAAWLRSRPLQLAGAWLAVLGGVAALVTSVAPESVVEPLRDPAAQVLSGALAVAALLVVAAGTALVAALRTGVPPAAHWAAWAWLPVAAALYGGSWLVVVGAQRLVPGPSGFLGGHVLVTLGVTGLGVALLVRGLHRPTVGRTGLALVVAALAKLVLFDLTTLSGLARVAAFIGAGLVLLAVGTWYAKRTASPVAGPVGPPAPAWPGGGAPAPVGGPGARQVPSVPAGSAPDAGHPGGPRDASATASADPSTDDGPDGGR